MAGNAALQREALAWLAALALAAALAWLLRRVARLEAALLEGHALLLPARRPSADSKIDNEATAAGGGRSVGGAGAIGRGPAVGDGTDAARRTVPHRALQRALNGCRDVSNKSWMVVPSAR